MNPVPLFLIIVTMPLLLGGCGEKHEGVNVEELGQRESIWYLKDSETPYSGKFYALHPNGQKMGEANYKDGKEDGLERVWHENGQKMLEGNWNDGRLDGLFVRWHENGQKAYEANYKDGKKISAKYWNSKGEIVDSEEEANK